MAYKGSPPRSAVDVLTFSQMIPPSMLFYVQTSGRKLWALPAFTVLTLYKITVFKTTLETVQSWFSSGVTSFTIALPVSCFVWHPQGTPRIHKPFCCPALGCVSTSQDVSGLASRRLPETCMDMQTPGHMLIDLPWCNPSSFSNRYARVCWIHCCSRIIACGSQFCHGSAKW